MSTAAIGPSSTMARCAAPKATAHHDGRDDLQGDADPERRPIVSVRVADEADQRGPECEGELVDPDDERDEAAESLARPLDAEDQAGQRRKVADSETEQRRACVDSGGAGAG